MPKLPVEKTTTREIPKDATDFRHEPVSVPDSFPDELLVGRDIIDSRSDEEIVAYVRMMRQCAFRGGKDVC